MLDLQAKYLDIVRKILAEYVPDKKVLAYGSRVTGHSHEGSDLDLVVINPSDPTLAEFRLAALREALSVSNLPILVDVLDWAKIPNSFRSEIQKNAIVVWEPVIK